MYEDYFQLSSRPFQLNPDARYFYNSKQHSRALAHLTYGLARGEGFVVITGEIGAGKTTLMEHLVSKLDQGRYIVGKIATTQLAPTGFLRSVLAALGIPKPANDKAKMLYQFEELLRKSGEEKRRILLIVDEVQNLPWGSLEELRMLSNLTSGMESHLQTFLVGQPQFREVLGNFKAEQLRQRVVTSYHLGALLEDEIGSYVHHRLSLAGWLERPRFDDDVFQTIFSHSGGIPRRVNLICDRLLLEAYLDNLHDVTKAVAEMVIQDLHEEEAGSVSAPVETEKFDRVLSVITNGPPPDMEDRMTALERRIEHQADLLKSSLEVLEHYVAKSLI
jgi:general secretion pathway protein A